MIILQNTAPKIKQYITQQIVGKFITFDERAIFIYAFTKRVATKNFKSVKSSSAA